MILLLHISPMSTFDVLPYSPGTLAPPLLSETDPDYARSMDVMFATYWFYPAKTTILFPEDEACIKLKMDIEANRFDPNSKLLRCAVVADYYWMYFL